MKLLTFPRFKDPIKKKIKKKKIILFIVPSQSTVNDHHVPLEKLYFSLKYKRISVEYIFYFCG